MARWEVWGRRNVRNGDRQLANLSWRSPKDIRLARAIRLTEERQESQGTFLEVGQHLFSKQVLATREASELRDIFSALEREGRLTVDWENGRWQRKRQARSS